MISHKVVFSWLVFSTGLAAQQTAIPRLSDVALQASAMDGAGIRSAFRLPVPAALLATPEPPVSANTASSVAAADAASASAGVRQAAVRPFARAFTSVTVTTKEQPLPEPVSTVTTTGQKILESAGTFQDLPRFLQTLPGVVGGSDIQNAMVVRGGNSMENLFVLDKIEVPNINHIAVAGSSGGLGSMLDTNDIASVTFSTASFASDLQTHLSSVVDIRTKELPRNATYTVDAGYSGAGIRVSRSVGSDKTLLLSARESVTNLVTDNIGLNGSPEFTNSFAKYAWNSSSRDHFWVESLFGRDRLKIVPTWDDAFETFAFDTTYSGWRDTAGMVWQHTYGNNSVGTWTASNSQQQQNLKQVDQVGAANLLLFKQNNLDGATPTRYEHLTVGSSGSSTRFGADARMNRIAYDVAQPSGVFSSYNSSPLPQSAFAAKPNFTTIDKATFAEGNLVFHKRVNLQTGLRMQMWGYRPAQLVTVSPTTAPEYRAYMPHATLGVLLTHRLNVKASFGRYADLPDYSILASLPQNAYLGLIHSDQIVLGAAGRIGHLLNVNVEAYRKTYTGYPVATNLPTVSLANTMPTINEPFTVMQLTSQGRGKVQGIEVTGRLSPWHHISIDSNAAFSRALYSGLDGIYRPGNFDFPFVWNTMGVIQMKKLNLTLRNTMSSGRPYTDVLEAQSIQQNRLIYDLTQVNALRGNMYQRLDFAVNRDFNIHGKTMNLHIGAINVLIHQNFYTPAWRPRCPVCGETNEHQEGLVPDFGASYSF